MAKVKFFGESRTKLGIAEVVIQADTVSNLIKQIALQHSEIEEGALKNFLIYVNGTPINKLKMFRTKLAPNDEVLFLSPASGG